MTNLVFDVGNVLLSFAPVQYLEQVAGSQACADTLMQTVFCSEEWQLLDRGAISFEQACSRFVGRQPTLRRQILDVMHGWVDMLAPIQPNVDMLSEWKQAHRLYYLSNMPAQAAGYLEEKYSFWEHFEGGIFSYTTGLIKPEPAIYELLFRRFDLSAADCIFIDDLQANIDTASALGMRGILLAPGADLPALLAEIL